MKKVTITILTGWGSDSPQCDVSAYINQYVPGLAIHRTLNSGGNFSPYYWTVTHIKSGKSLYPHFRRLRDAEDYIITLSIMKPKNSRKPINWAVDEKAILKQIKRFSKANQAVIRCVE